MKTERLTLRKFNAGDLADLFEYLSDEEVVKYEPYPALNGAQCKEYLERMDDSDDFWAVCLQENGKLIGQVYLCKGEQDTWEIGYVFNREHQGKGYATEAVKTLLGKVFTQLGAHRVFANCNPDNTSSWKLLERIGFRREGHLLKNVYFSKDDDGCPIWQDTYEYGLLSEEWPVD